MNTDVLHWLTDEPSDVSVRFQALRDLADAGPETLDPLRQRIAEEGWGVRFLAARGENGHWGRAFYSPKWTSSHYTLLELRNIGLPGDNPAARQTIDLILREFRLTPEPRDTPAAVSPRKSITLGGPVTTDVCINGMFLNYACYFGAPAAALAPIVDFLLAERMPDGGFNCQSNRPYARSVHSSLHTTISVLEGIHSYQDGGYTYRLQELLDAAGPAREFILHHRLFKSDHTGEVINPSFQMLASPWRWHYDILRALDHFQESGVPYDERMEDALEVIRNKRRADGTWPVQNRYAGEVFFHMEKTGGPSRWNTLRALRVLRMYDRGHP